MTTQTAQQLIGKEAVKWLQGLKVNVKIVDARSMFGRDDVKVTPVSGSGEIWVSLDTLEIKQS